MMLIFYKTVLGHSLLKNPYLLSFRYIRNIALRGKGPKRIEAEIKTLTKLEDISRIDTIEDYVDSLKKSKFGDELQLEKDFVEEDDLGHAVERCDQYCDMHLKEESLLRLNIKKQIVKRKYFELEKETCLLTHAAKEQIRFLHKSNPLEWNSKALAENFPISEAGVKKLLKSNFTQTDPEKIKVHDKEVAEKWESLKCGKPTAFISPLTYKLYKEGKLADDYFNGNPNLPTVAPPPPNMKEINVEKKKHTGEFSAIVQTYVAYREKKLLESGENSSENQVALRDTRDAKINTRYDYKEVMKFKYAFEELDDENTKIFSLHKKRSNKDNTDLPLSQFKEIMKEEAKYMPQEDGYISPEENNFENETPKKPNISQNCFVKISKYNRNENINATYDRQKNLKVVYTYNDKFGYQYPAGKTVKGKINLSPKQYKNGKLYKVEQSVYDDDGELLYKVPT